MKTAELTGSALDWAVAKAKGFLMVMTYGQARVCVRKTYSFEDDVLWRASTDWSQGGPIIEREGIATWRMNNGEWIAVFPGKFGYTGDNYYIDVETFDGEEGPTPLIAAMRCFVASKLGDEIDVPKELMQ